MTKQIKFHLQINEKFIRNVEELRENFVLQEVYELYKSKILSRWLSVWGEEDLVSKLNSIESEDKYETMRKLVETFNADCTEFDIQSSSLIIKYFDDQMSMLKDFHSSNNYFKSQILERYHHKYNERKCDVFEKSTNLSALKTIATDICCNYFELFKLDKDNFISEIIQSAPSALLAMLCVECGDNKLRELCFSTTHVRDYYNNLIAEVSPNIDLSSQLTIFSSILMLGDATHLKKNTSLRIVAESLTALKAVGVAYNVFDFSSMKMEPSKSAIVKFLAHEKGYEELLPDVPEELEAASTGKAIKDFLKEKLVDKASKQFKFFAGETDDYWKDLEPCGRIMVIHLPEGSMLRSAGNNGEEITRRMVDENPFPILNGLDYKSRTEKSPLIYMEAD